MRSHLDELIDGYTFVYGKTPQVIGVDAEKFDKHWKVNCKRSKGAWYYRGVEIRPEEED